MDEIGPLSEYRTGSTTDAARRRLAWMLAFSTLLHLALVLSLGESGAWQARSSRVAALNLRIIEPADPAPLQEARPPSAADLSRAVSALAPAAESARRAAPPSSPQFTHERTSAIGVAAVDDSPPAALPSITTTGESEPAAAPAERAAAPLGAEPAPPAASPEVVVRRVGEWIHKLQSTDPRRAELSWQQEGRSYTAVLTRRIAGDATDLERYDIEIVTPAESGRWATGLSFRRLAFSHFTQFVDRWDNSVQLHDDEIAGRFHANSSIIIGFDHEAVPRFLGKVTTAGRGFRIADSFGRRRREDIFQGGLETGVERIALPPQLGPLVDEAQRTDGHRRNFVRDTRIRFHADGSYGWSELRARSLWQLEHPSRSPVYLVARPGVELRVSGTVNGQVLVYSPERIVIEGDLRYARDPRVEPDSKDMLGLVSERRVEIAPPHATGRRDLEIHAAIYARRRFVVTHIDAPRAGTLRIYGSLTAGSVTATEPRYATKINFDSRFEERRPPGFPLTPSFELESADAAWRLEDGPRSN
jgi:hypothetical protein